MDWHGETAKRSFCSLTESGPADVPSKVLSRCLSYLQIPCTSTTYLMTLEEIL